MKRRYSAAMAWVLPSTPNSPTSGLASVKASTPTTAHTANPIIWVARKPRRTRSSRPAPTFCPVKVAIPTLKEKIGIMMKFSIRIPAVNAAVRPKSLTMRWIAM